MSSQAIVETPTVDARASHLRGSSKLQNHHLDRAAIVYVRQSSAHQVLENTESTERQYALVDRAVHLGWSGDRVEVIDEDQGRSGTTAEGRLGFQRLLSEVSLNHVGIILGTEMSRIARSNKDWHQLIEVCAIFRTLLADQDGLYDPTDYNDRLLLGLRGMMSEAEIHILQGRMHEAVLNKARRGDLYVLPPVGYVKTPAGIEELRRAGRTFADIADHLNREGFRPAQRAAKFHKDIVSRLFRKLRKQRASAVQIAQQEELGENEWFALTLAEKLQMPKNTLLEWMRRGWVHIVRQLPGYRGRKICWADAAEIDRLVRLRDAKRRACDPPFPSELTTPKVCIRSGDS